ncbi:glycosyltransferase family 2 protein [Streptomyces sp. NBC_00690]|uniref:glycosyltransferase family 2 protein n=1 Tax=Streptomyces sp. NBC_00690 TaxID=2975808 RepID=UPI002E2DF931|nr:glycosyltransferase [Streptomyces sp. NBC_00690]
MPRGRPTVSVIIPNYNYAKTLPTVLESVYAQTLAPLEVVVVDDCSTDNSRDIVRQFPCLLVEAPVNRGVSAARNLGVRSSRGEILFFLDSDIALAPDALANAVDLLLSDSATGCVHGIPDPEPLFDDGPVERYRTMHQHFWRRRSVGVVGTAVFELAAMPRAVFEEVGPFDENLRDSEDVEYSDRLGASYQIRLTETVRARHDDEDRLVSMLSEQFRRSQLLVPVAAVESRRGSGLRANRPTGVLAAALVPATLPLGLAAPWLLAVPAIFLLLFALSDPPLVRFVVRRRGAGFLLWFLLAHFLVHLALVSGALVGAVRWLVEPGFGPSVRRRADRTGAGGPTGRDRSGGGDENRAVAGR